MPSPSALSTNVPRLWTIPSSCAFLPIYRLQARFCGAEGLGKRSDTFYIPQQLSNDYGVTLTGSPIRGLTARAVVVLNEQNQVLHAELVSEIANEPDYEACFSCFVINQIKSGRLNFSDSL